MNLRTYRATIANGATVVFPGGNIFTLVENAGDFDVTLKTATGKTLAGVAGVVTGAKLVIRCQEYFAKAEVKNTSGASQEIIATCGDAVVMRDDIDYSVLSGNVSVAGAVPLDLRKSMVSQLYMDAGGASYQIATEDLDIRNREVIIQNKSLLRSGVASVVYINTSDTDEDNGIVLEDGESVVLETTSPLFAYSSGLNTISVSILEK
jgi:hypothetical protein